MAEPHHDHKHHEHHEPVPAVAAPLFQVDDLSVTLGGTSVLEHVSFTVNRGDIVAVIGPNGAGKTTLLRALLGMVPYEGRIIWHEVPRIGYVPQRFQFDKTFPLTVEELFLLKSGTGRFWLPAESDRQDIKKALSHTEVEHLQKRKLGELSAGQLQRVFVAYGLYGQPELLLFDEPTAGIDIGAEMTIYGLLRNIAEELGLTMLVVSHELSVVYTYARKVVCLNKTMACFGSPQQVLTPEQLQSLYGGGAGFYGHDH